jgi:DNA-binding MarR family transcriptional regulator
VATSSKQQGRKPAKARREAAALRCVRQLVGALTHSARAVEQRTGITNAQLFLLQQLAAEGDLTINELAARAETTQSTVSLIVSRLVANGFVRRVRSREDRRHAVVTITAKGLRLQRQAPQPATERLLTALRQLSPKRLDDLEHALALLLSKMNVDGEEVPMLFETDGRPRRNGKA